MTLSAVQEWVNNYFLWLFPVILLIAYLLYRGVRFVLARSAYSIALKTENVYDDLFVDRLQPFRFAWGIPLLLIYFLSKYLTLEYSFVENTALVLLILILVDFIIAILNGINDVYKHNPRYTGVSVAGYIGILKVLVVVGGIVIIISFLFEVEPVTLLSGVGAWLAVLLLIFRDTILSFLASIQISTQKLIKEGDSVDIPAFDASGTITNIDLQTITVQNYDNTVTTIPTSKIVDVGFKNYRVMIESGARRLKKAILLDVNSIKFCDEDLINNLDKVDFLSDFAAAIPEKLSKQTTNLKLFMDYVRSYLKTKKEVRQRRYPFIVRVLEPTADGLPLEIYIFVKSSSWDKFEEFQSEILVHFMAVLPYFELKVFQS
jgi:miniconductance mechanosensitive channel